MPIRMKKAREGLSEQVLTDFEERIGCGLPSDYREFLMQYNGGIPETNLFDIPQIKGGSGVSKFLSVEEVVSEKERLGKRLIEGAWPIAHAQGGNLVCIDLDDNLGNIYFWDHELEAEENELPSGKNMFLLASSFSGFLDLLKEFDPKQIVLKPGQVKSAWIDPSLLKSRK